MQGLMDLHCSTNCTDCGEELNIRVNRNVKQNWFILWICLTCYYCKVGSSSSGTGISSQCKMYIQHIHKGWDQTISVNGRIPAHEVQLSDFPVTLHPQISPKQLIRGQRAPGTPFWTTVKGHKVTLCGRKSFSLQRLFIGYNPQKVLLVSFI